MRILVVGIAGGSGSGKTTAAALVSRRLGARCLVVEHDRYYRPLPRGVDPARFNFDHPGALESDRLVADLDALRSGRAARLPRYDFTAHRRAEAWDEVHPRPIVLVEGILVLADPLLRAALDHRVYVDAPDDVRLLRRIRRDLAERGRALDDVLQQYERTVRPMHDAHVAPSRAWADLVLDGTRDPEGLALEILALLGRSRPRVTRPPRPGP